MHAHTPKSKPYACICAHILMQTYVYTLGLSDYHDYTYYSIYYHSRLLDHVNNNLHGIHADSKLPK